MILNMIVIVFTMKKMILGESQNHYPTSLTLQGSIAHHDNNFLNLLTF
jgi:hypothetical protein